MFVCTSDLGFQEFVVRNSFAIRVGIFWERGDCGSVVLEEHIFEGKSVFSLENVPGLGFGSCVEFFCGF